MEETVPETEYIGLLSRDGFLYTVPEELIRFTRSKEENGLPISGAELITDLYDASLALSAASRTEAELFVANIDGNKPCIDQLIWVNIHRLQTTRTPTVKPQQIMSEQFDKEQLQESMVCAYNFFGM